MFRAPGWLEMFRARSEVVCKALQGERGNDLIQTAKQFKEKLLAILESTNVFNCDEVGLFWVASGKKTLLLKGDDPSGTKVSKKRLTVFIVTAMDGHM